MSTWSAEYYSSGLTAPSGVKTALSGADNALKGASVALASATGRVSDAVAKNLWLTWTYVLSVIAAVDWGYVGFAATYVVVVVAYFLFILRTVKGGGTLRSLGMVPVGAILLPPVDDPWVLVLRLIATCVFISLVRAAILALMLAWERVPHLVLRGCYWTFRYPLWRLFRACDVRQDDPREAAAWLLHTTFGTREMRRQWKAIAYPRPYFGWWGAAPGGQYCLVANTPKCSVYEMVAPLREQWQFIENLFGPPVGTLPDMSEINGVTPEADTRYTDMKAVQRYTGVKETNGHFMINGEAVPKAQLVAAATAVPDANIKGLCGLLNLKNTEVADIAYCKTQRYFVITNPDGLVKVMHSPDPVVKSTSNLAQLHVAFRDVFAKYKFNVNDISTGVRDGLTEWYRLVGEQSNTISSVPDGSNADRMLEPFFREWFLNLEHSTDARVTRKLAMDIASINMHGVPLCLLKSTRNLIYNILKDSPYRVGFDYTPTRMLDGCKHPIIISAAPPGSPVIYTGKVYTNGGLLVGMIEARLWQPVVHQLASSTRTYAQVTLEAVHVGPGNVVWQDGDITVSLDHAQLVRLYETSCDNNEDGAKLYIVAACDGATGGVTAEARPGYHAFKRNLIDHRSFGKRSGGWSPDFVRDCARIMVNGKLETLQEARERIKAQYTQPSAPLHAAAIPVAEAADGDDDDFSSVDSGMPPLETDASAVPLRNVTVSNTRPAVTEGAQALLTAMHAANEAKRNASAQAIAKNRKDKTKAKRERAKAAKEMANAEALAAAHAENHAANAAREADAIARKNEAELAAKMAAEAASTRSVTKILNRANVDQLKTMLACIHAGFVSAEGMRDTAQVMADLNVTTTDAVALFQGEKTFEDWLHGRDVVTAEASVNTDNGSVTLPKTFAYRETGVIMEGGVKKTIKQQATVTAAGENRMIVPPDCGGFVMAQKDAGHAGIKNYKLIEYGPMEVLINGTWVCVTKFEVDPDHKNIVYAVMPNAVAGAKKAKWLSPRQGAGVLVAKLNTVSMGKILGTCMCTIPSPWADITVECIEHDAETAYGDCGSLVLVNGSNACGVHSGTRKSEPASNLAMVPGF